MLNRIVEELAPKRCETGAVITVAMHLKTLRPFARHRKEGQYPTVKEKERLEIRATRGSRLRKLAMQCGAEGQTSNARGGQAMLTAVPDASSLVADMGYGGN